MPKRIDLSQLSPAELEEIGNAVLKNLARRLVSDEERDGPTQFPHDKHGSVHSRMTIKEEESVPEEPVVFE